MNIGKTASFSKVSLTTDPAQKYREEEKRVDDELGRIAKDSVEIQGELKEVDLKSGLTKPDPKKDTKGQSAALSGFIDFTA